MNNVWRVLSIVLIFVGGLALALGGFDYTRDTHEVEIGPVQLQVQENEHVNVPVWVGAGCLLVGIAILVGTLRQR